MIDDFVKNQHTTKENESSVFRGKLFMEDDFVNNQHTTKEN